MFITFIIILCIPFVFTAWNIYDFFSRFGRKKDTLASKIIEPISIIVGLFYSFVNMVLVGVTTNDWHVQIYDIEMHTFISGKSMATFNILMLVTVISYIVLKYFPSQKMPPIPAAFSIAGAYIGVAVCVALALQIFPELFPVSLYLGNIIIILVKNLCVFVYRRNTLIQNGEHFTKFPRLAKLLNSWSGLPVLGLVALIPLVGIIFIIMLLFGQTPSDLIKMWTDTADWTFSQKTPPQSIPYDAHYLCTVAAGGHREVVKPLRTGLRHGHRVVVNRQLCIANAFEEVIQQRMPKFHRAVRSFYDRTGYPIAKHIKSKFVADAVYFLMKPLEWLFLVILYTTCSKPEDRIAVQYPHKMKPKGA